MIDEDPFEIRTGANYALCWVCQGDKKKMKDPSRSSKAGHALSTYQRSEKNVLYFIDNNILQFVRGQRTGDRPFTLSTTCDFLG